ncbi:MAG: hypothetical protein U0528_20795 [Anaerolineae bacterium]
MWITKAKLSAFKTSPFTLATLTYTLLSVILLFPLLIDLGGKVAGYDFFHFHWNFWWIQHALSAGQDIYQTNYVLFPFTTNLSYHTLAISWYPLWALLQPLIGTIASVNVIILIGCWLNGMALFAFLRSEKIPVGLALIGGAALQSLPTVRYFLYNTHLNLMAWFWIPLQLLIWKQILRAVERKPSRAVFWTLVQGIAIWLMVLTDLQWIIFLAFVLIPYALLTIWRIRQRRQQLALMLLTAGGISIAHALALLWYAGPPPSILAFHGVLVPGNVESRPGIPFPDGLIRLLDHWWEWNHPSLGGFITLMLLFALLITFWRRKHSVRADQAQVNSKGNDALFWSLIMLPPLILSLGPTLTIAGQAIPLPFRWLFTLTSGMFWMPWRLAPIFAIAAIIAAAKLLTNWFAELSARQRLFFMLISGVVLAFSAGIFSYAPLSDAPANYDFYTTIREDGAPDYVVVEVPVAAGTGEVILGDPRAVALQYYGIVHQRRMINGFVARAPLENIWWLNTDHPLMSWLGQRRVLDPAEADSELRQLIPEWHIGYFVIHQRVDQRGRSGKRGDSGILQRLIWCAHCGSKAKSWSIVPAHIRRAVRRNHALPVRKLMAATKSTSAALAISASSGSGWYHQEAVRYAGALDGSGRGTAVRRCAASSLPFNGEHRRMHAREYLPSRSMA